MSQLPPALIETHPTTEYRLTHLTWHPHWRAVLDRFAATVPVLGPVLLVSYERPDDAEDADDLTAPWREPAWKCLHLSSDVITDPGLRREMDQFANAFYEFELPDDDAAIVTDMLVGADPDAFQHLLGWMRGAVVEITGERLSAHAVPTTHAGNKDGSGGLFPPHADMWHTELLFNVFNRVLPGSNGVPLLYPIDSVWDILADAGMPRAHVDDMRSELANAAVCGNFEDFNGHIYNPEHPWCEAATAALQQAAWCHPMRPGEGYFVNDRRWLHGRTPIAVDATEHDRAHRLYRLGYNNRRLMERAASEGFDWTLAGTRKAGCMDQPQDFA
ncbi:hypothetical protein Mycsm_05589 [Mycobacterium sp. JS623]|uniref:hypothetical protein n=1 Tax=Mycobacterium sp. JS623 TaxID=212767 RepID=UPI0002A5691C|nr:hypothetical protein [Mycobacterium sp. JS623]AGB25767.1 hypothetical protein Mycsm_05589 [Mycobacterium sp. JS623]